MFSFKDILVHLLKQFFYLNFIEQPINSKYGSSILRVQNVDPRLNMKCFLKLWNSDY